MQALRNIWDLDVSTNLSKAITPKQKGRPRTFDRNKAIEACISLFWKNGYEATSIGMICELLNIGPASFYAAFGTKRSFFELVLERYEAIYWKPLLEQFESTPNIKEALRDFFSGAAKIMTANSDVLGCLIAITASEREGSVSKMSQSKRIGLQTLFLKRLNEAQATNQLKLTLPADVIAQALLAMISGMSINAKNGMQYQEVLKVADAALFLISD